MLDKVFPVHNSDNQSWRVGFSYLVALSVLFIDQFTKLLAERFLLVPGRRVPVISGFDFFNLFYIKNPGGAWGILAGYRIFFIVVAIIVSIVCVWLIHSYYRESFIFPIALVLGGALGNLLDRFITTGGVVDFLDFGFYSVRWPTFNFADFFLTVATFWLIFIIFKAEFSSSDDC